MNYSEVLNKYMKLLDCGVKKLAEASGLTPATVSRYKSSDRVPVNGSEQYEAIIRGLVLVAETARQGASETELEIQELTEEKIRDEFLASYRTDGDDFDYDGFRLNLAELLSQLHISMKSVAKGIDCDISYISRIIAGNRKPSKPEIFIGRIADYVTDGKMTSQEKQILAELLDIRPGETEDKEKLRDKLYTWLYSGDNSPGIYAQSLIKKMDAFDLASYKTEDNEDHEAQLDPETYENGIVSYDMDRLVEMGHLLVRDAVQNCPDEPIYIYWDISDTENAMKEEVVNSLKYALENGMLIRFIHADDGPTNELVTWLERWMPLYMSGQIEPYYIDGETANISRSSIMVSGNMVMTVDTVAGHFENGRIYLTSEKDEVAFYNNKIQNILQCARPVISIVRYDNREDRKSFMKSRSEEAGERLALLSTPPIYTISDDLLDRILSRNKVSSKDRKRITAYIKEEKERMEKVLENSRVEDHIPNITEESSRLNPVFLSLSGLFYEKDIFYTYEEYEEHLDLTRGWEDRHKNYSLVMRRDVDFRNIQIFLQRGKWVLISKNKAPAIHFIVRHPGIREGLEQMIDIFSRRGK